MSTFEQESPEQESQRSLSRAHDLSVKNEIIEEDREFSPVPYRRHATVKRTSVHLPGWNSRKLIRDDVPNADGWHLNSDRSSRDQFTRFKKSFFFNKIANIKPKVTKFSEKVFK
jgi:hypothetical protein